MPVRQQVSEAGQEAAESEEADDASDFQAAVPTMTRCALFAVHPLLAFLPELTNGSWGPTNEPALPGPKYLEHPPSDAPEFPPDPYARELAQMQAQQAEAELLSSKSPSALASSIDSKIGIQLDVVVVQGRAGLARNFSGLLLQESNEAGTKEAMKTPSFTGLLETPHEKAVFLACMQSLRANGLITIMAEPRLVTMSGRQASFLSGGQEAIPVPAGLGQVGVEFEEFGSRLNFVPTILSVGKIRLSVESELRQSPEDPVQRMKTTSEFKKGVTLLIAKVSQKPEAKNQKASKNTGKSKKGKREIEEQDEEMIILVTPSIIRLDR
jgi:hypothetical protein